MNFVDNHDIDRLSTAEKRQRVQNGAGHAGTPGAGYIQIYYGNEIMLEGIQSDYQGHRFTFPGGWKNDKRDAFTPAGRTKEEKRGIWLSEKTASLPKKQSGASKRQKWCSLFLKMAYMYFPLQRWENGDGHYE